MQIVAISRLNQPIIIPIDHRKYRLLKDHETELETSFGLEIMIKVREGFLNDGASVPRFLWWFLRPDGVHRAACLIHDYLYENAGHLAKDDYFFWSDKDRDWLPRTAFLSKKIADYLFREMLIAYGVDKFRAYLAWAAVSLLGRGNYGKKPVKKI